MHGRGTDAIAIAEIVAAGAAMHIAAVEVIMTAYAEIGAIAEMAQDGAAAETVKQGAAVTIAAMSLDGKQAGMATEMP